MYLDSLLAVQSAVHEALPEGCAFYTEAVPASPVLPALYMEHMASSTERLSGSSILCHIQWQLVYLPPLLPDGTPDTMNKLAVTDQLMEALHAGPVLQSPNGTVFEVEEFTGGADEAGMYVAVKLQTQMLQSRSEPGQPMGTLHVAGLTGQ